MFESEKSVFASMRKKDKSKVIADYRECKWNYNHLISLVLKAGFTIYADKECPYIIYKIEQTKDSPAEVLMGVG